MASLPKAVQEAMAKAAMSSQEITAKAQADAMKAQQAAPAARTLTPPNPDSNPDSNPDPNPNPNPTLTQH